MLKSPDGSCSLRGDVRLGLGSSLFYKGLGSTAAELFPLVGMCALDWYWLALINFQWKNEENEFKAEFPTCLNQTGMKPI